MCCSVIAKIHLLIQLTNLRRYWDTCNEFEVQLFEFQEEKNAVHLNHEYARRQLERLKRTDVYNDTFHIWYDGHFGTINGLRMGTLPSQPVSFLPPLFPFLRKVDYGFIF